MTEREQKKNEMLEDLAQRFRDSANNLKHVARRIQNAAQLHEETRKRLDKAGLRLRNYVESQTTPLAFSYLEYLEFNSTSEFEKFRTMDVISNEEIASTDMDDLCRRLLDACPEAGGE